MKMAFGNIIYLLASDVETLEEISNLCGKKSESEPLISIEELKLLDEFEAVILMPRISPIRTKLVPYYEYILKLKKNPIARKVKLADLNHNSDVTRLDKLTKKDIDRNNKYKEAIRLLLE